MVLNKDLLWLVTSGQEYHATAENTLGGSDLRSIPNRLPLGPFIEDIVHDKTIHRMKYIHCCTSHTQFID